MPLLEMNGLWSSSKTWNEKRTYTTCRNNAPNATHYFLEDGQMRMVVMGKDHGNDFGGRISDRLMYV